MRGRGAWWFVAALAMTAAALSIAATRGGPGVTADSIIYVSSARHLADGKGYRSYSGQEVTDYAPGLPIVLAAGDRIGVDPTDGARAIDAAALAALVVLAFVLARRHLRTSTVLSVTAVVAVSVPLLGVYSTIWSESLFCVLALGFVIVLEQLAATRARSSWLLVGAGALVSLAFALRYSGMVFVPIGLVVIAVAARVDGARSMVGRCAVFFTAAVCLPAVIVIRNVTVDGSLLGARGGSVRSIGGVVGDLVRTVRGWTVADSSVSSVVATIALVVVVVVVGYGLTRARPSAVMACSTLIVFVVGYVGYLLVSEVTTNIDPISTRFLVPVYIPLVVLAAVAVEALAVKHRWVSVIAAVAVGMWVLGSGAKAIQYAHATRGGFARSSWASAAFLAAVDHLPADARIVSNVGDGIYYTTGREPITVGPDDVAQVRRAVTRDGPVFLVWYRASGRDAVGPAALRRAGLAVERIAAATDGAVYRVS